MFFNLSTRRLHNFPYYYTLPNGLVLNTDDGWESYTTDSHTVIIKGYANQYSLSDIVNNLIVQDVPIYKGNFCAFVADNQHVKILHDTNRGFPLWKSDVSITNLAPLEEQIWADQILTIHSDMKVKKSYFKTHDKNTDNLTDEKIIDKLHSTICDTYEQFLSHNTKPLKIFISGGIDTTTAWAYLDYFTKNYEIIDYEYIKFTPFWTKNRTALKNFWGYKQIHLWDEDCVLITGSNGDENMLRGPLTLALALKKLGITFDDILRTGDYHYYYLMIKNYKEVMEDLDSIYPKINDIENYILNRNVNDHQHWHIDKTITFTPFKNIDLLALILTGSNKLLTNQARHGSINRELITKLDPTKLDKVSLNKNKNPLEAL